MGPQLLPASAAAFAPRATHVSVVLGSQTEPWLTQLLRRIGREKFSLNTVVKQQKYLSRLLSSSTAIWTITSLMVPRAPDFELHSNPDLLIEALMNYHILHIQGYIVLVDMVFENEIVFKLTSESIEALVNHHEGIYCANISASNLFPWPRIDAQIKKLHTDFVQSINKFVYRTSVSAIDEVQEDGSGELLCGESEQVKNKIMNLFRPLARPSYHKLYQIFSQAMSPNCPDCSYCWPQISRSSVILGPVEENKLVLGSDTTSSSHSATYPPFLELGDIQPQSQFFPLNPKYLINDRIYSPLQLEASIPSTLHSCAIIAEQQ
ncbi:hypothetical protein GcC1_182035 [Golovinomyces cichoracearum]|uniref:Uncharacterized protein n=1 Tax=Golovinomyces cichoracearum TaxID=62708 RepID=A0A420HM10_9PEZI|nr:hypothetical protein GcC1_182035 [Golovinomyces cichoracearum]